ncbi:hypothetical protein DFH06DRAFT_1325782 [Mycena polygramma]|nr:hypothetical protein DFH06DRAFT_1325782 [Mycena polygramma]
MDEASASPRSSSMRAHVLFPGNTSQLLLLLSYGTAVTSTIGFFFVRAIPLSAAESEHNVVPTVAAEAEATIFHPVNSSHTPLLDEEAGPSSPTEEYARVVELSSPRRLSRGRSTSHCRSHSRKPDFGLLFSLLASAAERDVPDVYAASGLILTWTLSARQTSTMLALHFAGASRQRECRAVEASTWQLEAAQVSTISIMNFSDRIIIDLISDNLKVLRPPAVVLAPRRLTRSSSSYSLLVVLLAPRRITRSSSYYSLLVVLLAPRRLQHLLLAAPRTADLRGNGPHTLPLAAARAADLRSQGLVEGERVREVRAMAQFSGSSPLCVHRVLCPLAFLRKLGLPDHLAPGWRESFGHTSRARALPPSAFAAHQCLEGRRCYVATLTGTACFAATLLSALAAPQRPHTCTLVAVFCDECKREMMSSAVLDVINLSNERPVLGPIARSLQTSAIASIALTPQPDD